MQPEIPFISAVGHASQDVNRDIANMAISFTTHHNDREGVRQKGRDLIKTVQDAIQKIASELNLDLTGNKRHDAAPKTQPRYLHDQKSGQSKPDGHAFTWSTRLRVPAEHAAKFIDWLMRDTADIKEIDIRASYGLSEELARATSGVLYKAAYLDAMRQLDERARIIGVSLEDLEVFSLRGSDEPMNEGGGYGGGARLMALEAADAGGGGNDEPALQLVPGAQRVSFTLQVRCRCQQTVRLKPVPSSSHSPAT